MTPNPLKAALFVAAALALAGCGMFRANAQIGPDLRPRADAGVSLPFGK